MYPTVSAVVILLISFGCVYGQQCPSEATTQLFTGDGSISLPLTVPACLTCNFFINNALANPTDFTWSRNPNSDMTPLTNGSFGTVLITSDTRTLILFDPAAVVSVNDIIRCDSASNGQHLITIQSFIFANPIIIPQTDTVNVIEGSNLTINCTDPGNTGNTRYQWFNSTGSGLTSTVSQNQVPLALSFTNIQRTDSGVYICRSTNPSILPGVNRDSNVTVSVQFQVEITSISSNANTLVIGSNYTVNCTYVSNPPPNVTWEHNGTVLESNEYITINTQSTYSELRISLQGLQNSGNYLCKAQNILGNDTSSTVSLTVQVNPDPVIGLTAPTNDITTMSVRLTWSLGFNGNAVITGVTITYTAIGNNETPQTGVEPFPGESAVEGTIPNLQPFTNYSFEAVVRNDAGTTSVPETVVVQTLPLVPTPPTVDSVSPINSTSLRVTWTDNRNPFTQSIVTSYRLDYYITGQPGTLASVDMISSTSYDITGLNKGTNYTVRVYATNSAGESTTASNSVTSRTDVDPPSAVMGVLTTPYEYSICVSWSSTVADNGGQSLSSFRIYLRNEEEINNEYMLVTVLPPTVTSYRIENLMNSTEYSIIIAATNMEGGHGANTTYTTRTGNPIPEDQNITLTTSNITAFTALIQWEGTSNGELILQYRSQGSEWSRDDRQIYVTGRTSYMLNSSLIPETSYEIRLIQSFVSNCLQRASPVRAFTTIMLQIIVSINGTNDRVTTIAGNEVTLECNLNTGGAPPSDVTWSNDKGEPIPDDVISGSNRLVFTSPTVSDSANYTCTFQNVSYTFELVIDPQPTAPPFVFPQFAIYIIAGVVGAIIIVFIIVLIIVCCCICRDKETKISSSKTYDFSKNKKGTGGMWLDGGASGLSPSNPSYRRTTEDYVDYPGGRGRSLTNEDTSSTSFIKNNRKEEEGSRERLTDDKYADLQFDSNAKPYAEQRVEYATVGHTSFTKHTDV